MFQVKINGDLMTACFDSQKEAIDFVNELFKSNNKQLESLIQEQKKLLDKYDLKQYAFETIADESDWEEFEKLQKEINSIRGKKIEYLYIEWKWGD